MLSISDKKKILEKMKQSGMNFKVNTRVVKDSEKIKTVIEDVGPTLRRIGEQYEEQRRQIKELKQQLENFKRDVYKDEQISALKEKYEKLKKKSSSAFSVSEEQKRQIGEWIKRHEDRQHGGFPTYKGAIGGGYVYEFLPTTIGVTGSVICLNCRTKAIREAKGDRKRYVELLKEKDAEFVFKEED